ncbi:LLM class flavin-dependent oxidoreductase [Ktedonobacter robiniae]|uniref:Luciferase n=1 Tax=Ktedonobacter robiniae TaxID=2778365 RepID=A0ABQ3V3J3_9CHLR|nr:LLM class flavin-dependent oxidoreductase [Ktedonobacter robiniae]GHO59734.1 luciferase [Ktedonobacter robiniae]
MHVSIGLPGTIQGVTAERLREWARKADAGPFASLTSLDRLVYHNYEALTTLAAVSSVTRRVRLMTTILIAPLHNAGMLAKQTATLDALSGGRLTLGLAVGGREDDFLAAPVPFHERGKRFDEQLEIMHRVWSGQALNEQVGAIGPAPVQQGGPEVLIGGNSPAALQRSARWGNGFISGGGDPSQASQGYSQVEQAWRNAGRPGKPRFVACGYYGLGPKAQEGISSYLGHYYSFLGPMAEKIIQSASSTPEAVKATIKGFSDKGVDELCLWPCLADLDQVDRLADLVASSAS